MLGKIKANRGDLKEAKFCFEESKKFGVSDREIKNNIAVLNMIGKKYKDALPVLYQLYSDEPSDSKVIANLIISALYAERFDIVSEVLKSSPIDEDHEKMIGQLSSLIGVSYTGQEGIRNLSKKKINEQEDKKTISVKSNSNEKLTDISKRKENNYRIQVLATDDFIDKERLLLLKSSYGKVYLYQHGFWKRYCVGSFNSFQSAKASLENMNIKGAFIVNYKNYRYNIL